MKYCSFLLGNTSSGFIEASFFPKYVINLGQRQKGRIVTPNIKNIEINKKEILDAVNNFKQTIFPEYEGIYGNGKAAEKIISILKNL
jgi:GDP/UDP-N,N'-diacetylbacillosamine 2-epimerase (hydrolysing)